MDYMKAQCVCVCVCVCVLGEQYAKKRFLGCVKSGYIL